MMLKMSCRFQADSHCRSSRIYCTIRVIDKILQVHVFDNDTRHLNEFINIRERYITKNVIRLYIKEIISLSKNLSNFVVIFPIQNVSVSTLDLNIQSIH